MNAGKGIFGGILLGALMPISPPEIQFLFVSQIDLLPNWELTCVYVAKRLPRFQSEFQIALLRMVFYARVEFSLLVP
jgi:hypothetical protein